MRETISRGLRETTIPRIEKVNIRRVKETNTSHGIRDTILKGFREKIS